MKTMALDLNNVIVPYQEFYGRNVEQMPKLIAEGRVPISVAGIMAQRLNSGKEDWKDNYFDSGDAIAYHPDGKFKIILDSHSLREINAESKLKNGALVLADGLYESLQGQEFTRKDLVLGKDMSAADVKAHPVWQLVARDGNLLNEYADKMFAEMKQRFDYTENMGFYVADANKTPTLRALYASWLESGSRLRGNDNLESGYGRLVGVAPEALSANGILVKPSLETALNVVNEYIHKSGMKISRQ